MKSSKIIVTIALIIVIAIIGVFLKNKNSKFKDYEMYPESKGQAYAKPSVEVQKRSYEYDKEKKNNAILKVGAGIFAVIIIGFIIAKSSENKKDPIRNLATLKDKNIISQSEYDEKIERTKEIQNERKSSEIRKREYNKLVAELENLKAKGILTEEEYQQKLIKIKENTA